MHELVLFFGMTHVFLIKIYSDDAMMEILLGTYVVNCMVMIKSRINRKPTSSWRGNDRSSKSYSQQ